MGLFTLINLIIIISMMNVIFTYLKGSLNSIVKNSTSISFEEFSHGLLKNGQMADCCLTYREYEDLLDDLERTYPNFLETFSIGETYNKKVLRVIKLKPKYRANKAILFTGMHHGREPVSMMMNLYILVKLIHLREYDKTVVYNSKNHTSSGSTDNTNFVVDELLDHVNVFFLPVINVDGYILNNELYAIGERNYMVRKNRRNDIKEFSCSEDYDQRTIGVDLNRNYGYKFAYDDKGSSDIACQEDYRGPAPFSEAETAAVKQFIDAHPEIKLAFNYHSYGNLLIQPFNYADPKDSAMNLFMNYTLQKSIYDEFKAEGHLPKGNLQGNGMETIKYKANGEAADWMLGVKKIVAFSPELGSDDPNSNSFYPNRKVMFDILKNNLNPALYALSRTSYYILFRTIKKIFLDCEIIKKFEHKFLEKDDEEKKEVKICNHDFYQYSTQIQIHNNGFSDFKGEMEFEMKFNVDKIRYLTVELNSGHKSFIIKNKTENTGTSIIGNSNTVILLDKNYTGWDMTFDKVKFKIDFIEAFTNKVLEVKFYVDKVFPDMKKNQTFVDIKRINYYKEAKDYFENLRLKFNDPNFSLKFSEFEKFEMSHSNSSDFQNENNFYSMLKEYYKIIVLSTFIGLILLLLYILIRFLKSPIRSYPVEVVRQSERSYLELDNIGRDF